MVSASFLTKVFVAFVPLTSVVYAQYNVSVPQLPSLLDATADDLVAGLEAGSFTSLDLVQVRKNVQRCSLSSTYV
jgi:amidase